MSMELHTHGLFGHLNACLLAQEHRESFGGPVRGLLPNFMRISLDHSQQFAFPSCCIRRSRKSGGASGNGIQSAGQEMVKHAHDCVLTAQDDASHLRQLVSGLGQAEASDSEFGFPHWEPLHRTSATRQEELDLIEVRESGLTQFPLFIVSSSGSYVTLMV